MKQVDDTCVGVVIETYDLTRAFRGETALDGLTIDVEEGEVLALLGPNGAGKTTTVRLLNGILRPDRGRATVLGMDPATEGDDVRRRTGVMTEAAGLDDRLTARENLVLIGRIRGMGARECDVRATELLDRLDIGRWADTSVRGFSTGQRKRVALALALLHDPEVLFLDEPTSGLDPAATRDVLDLIGSLARERRRTVVVCTHFLGDAGRLANRMAVLDRGRLRAFGTPEALAAELWDGLDVDVDLAAPADVATLSVIRGAAEVLACEPTARGARVRVSHREAIPALVQALSDGHADIYGVTAHPPTLEDVYFAVQERAVDA